MTANDMTVHIFRLAKTDEAAAERIRFAGTMAFRAWREYSAHPAARQAAYLVAQEVQAIVEMHRMNGRGLE